MDYVRTVKNEMDNRHNNHRPALPVFLRLEYIGRSERHASRYSIERISSNGQPHHIQA